MRAALMRQWFLCALAVGLGGGLLAGCYGPENASKLFLQIVHPAWTTAIVLFLMAFSLDTSRLTEALRDPQAVLWGSIVNLGLTPLVAWPLARLQSRPDFSLGLMITAIAPCTLATASVFTRRAGGNDAISLLVTLVTNIACVVISPLWLAVILKSDTRIDLAGMMGQLMCCVLLPTLLGQLAQRPRWGAALSLQHRGLINTAAQWLVLLLVLVAATRGGTILRGQPTGPGMVALLEMAAACVAVHLASLALGWFGARALRSPADNAIAVMFAASQKTLPIGLLMATHPLVARDDSPYITFPLLAFHAGQLLIDAMLADWWARRQLVRQEATPLSAIPRR